MNTIVAARYLFAKLRLVDGLRAVRDELASGDAKPVRKAIDDFYSAIEISIKTEFLETSIAYNAEWYYALGPRDQKRFQRLTHDLYRFTKQLGFLDDSSTAKKLLEQFDEILKEVAWVETVVRKGGEDEIPHGDFTIVPMKGVSRRSLTECLEALDAAAAAIRKKFSQVLYGKVYVSRSLGNAAASYLHDHDSVQLSLNAKKSVGDVVALCHEFGHRYYMRFFKDAPLKTQFRNLTDQVEFEKIVFDKPTRAKLADEWMSIVKEHRQGKTPPKGSDLLQVWTREVKKYSKDIKEVGWKYVQGDDSLEKPLWERIAIPAQPTIEVQTDKVVKEPLWVTPYAKSKADPNENFAEAFAFYVTGKALPPEVSAIMDRL